MFTIHTESVEKTLALGFQLGEILQGGEILALSGELGAGKTVFVKGLARGLGIGEVITSPTFVLVKSYQGRLILHHIDFYRLKNPGDLESIGFDDFLRDDGILAIEWAEKFLPDLPRPFLHITFYYEGEQNRRIDIHSPFKPSREGEIQELLQDL